MLKSMKKHALLIGGATGREHAIAKHFARRTDYILSAILWAEHRFVEEICTGTYAIIDLNDVQRVYEKVLEIAPDYVIIGQGEVIQRGIKDMLDRAGIRCIAPTKEAALIEGSKTYLRGLLDRLEPELNPRFCDFFIFSEETVEYIRSFDEKVVIKCDGVISGPRVRIFELPSQSAQAIENARNWLQDYGHIIVEEYVQGYEVAVMSFTDGIHLVHTPPFKNHKRINDNNMGENTSGMGTIVCDFSWLTTEAVEKMHKISEMVLKECTKTSIDLFTGSLYGEFLVQENRVKVIEYNCRFGNPSSLNILCLSKVDFPTICEHILDERVDELIDIWEDKVCISAYAVPERYTIDRTYVGTEIDFSEVDQETLFVGNIKYSENQYLLKNSRAFAICKVGNTIDEARERVYSEMKKVKGHIQYRKDIGIWEI